MKKWFSLVLAFTMLMSVMTISTALANDNSRQSNALSIAADQWTLGANYTAADVADGTKITSGYPQGDGDRIVTYNTALDGSKKVSVTMKLDDYIPAVGNGNDNCIVIRLVRESDKKAVYNASAINFKIAIPEGQNNTTYQPQGPGDILTWYVGDLKTPTEYSIEPMDSYSFGTHNSETGGWVLSVAGAQVAAIPFTTVPKNYFDDEKAYFQFTAHVPANCNPADPGASTPVAFTFSSLNATVYSEKPSMNIAADQWTLGANYTAENATGGTKITSAFPQGDRVVTYNTAVDANEKISVSLKLDQHVPGGNSFVLQLLNKSEKTSGVMYNGAKLGVELCTPADGCIQGNIPDSVINWYVGSLTDVNTFSFEKGEYNLGEGKAGTGWIFSINDQPVSAVPYTVIPENYFTNGEAYLQFSFHMPSNLTGDPATSTPAEAFVTRLDATPYTEPSPMKIAADQWTLGANYTATDATGGTKITTTIPQGDRVVTYKTALDANKKVSVKMKLDQTVPNVNNGDLFVLQLMNKTEKDNNVIFNAGKLRVEFYAPETDRIQANIPGSVINWYVGSLTEENIFSFEKGEYNLGEGKAGTGWIFSINDQPVSAVPYTVIPENYFTNGEAYLQFSYHLPTNLNSGASAEAFVTRLDATPYTEPAAPTDPTAQDHSAKNWVTNDPNHITISDRAAGTVFVDTLAQQDRANTFQIPLDPTKEVSFTVQLDKALAAGDYSQYFFFGLSKNKTVNAIESSGPTFHLSNAQAEPAAVSPTGAPIGVSDGANYPAVWWLAETDDAITYTIKQASYSLNGQEGEGWVLCIDGNPVAAISYAKVASNYFGNGPAYLYFGIQNAGNKPITMTVSGVKGTVSTQTGGDDPIVPDTPVDPDLPELDSADKIDISADSFNATPGLTVTDAEAGVQVSGNSQYDKTTVLKMPIDVTGEINIDVRFNEIPERCEWFNITIANSLSVNNIADGGFEGFNFFNWGAPQAGELIRFTIKLDEKGENYIFLKNGVEVATSPASAAGEKFLHNKGYLHLCLGSATGAIGTYTILDLHATEWTQPAGDEFSYLGGAIPDGAIKNYIEITDDPDLQTVKH